MCKRRCEGLSVTFNCPWVTAVLVKCSGGTLNLSSESCLMDAQPWTLNDSREWAENMFQCSQTWKQNLHDEKLTSCRSEAAWNTFLIPLSCQPTEGSLGLERLRTPRRSSSTWPQWPPLTRGRRTPALWVVPSLSLAFWEGAIEAWNASYLVLRITSTISYIIHPSIF